MAHEKVGNASAEGSSISLVDGRVRQLPARLTLSMAALTFCGRGANPPAKARAFGRGQGFGTIRFDSMLMRMNVCFSVVD